MDTLEAYEYARTLRRDQLFFIARLPVPVFPVKVNADLPRPRQDFNQSAVFFLDDDIIVKMPIQNRVEDIDLPSEALLVDISLGSFVSRDRERDTFSRLKHMPHPNLVRELEVGDRYIAFFERLSPLTTVWEGADMPRRRRWAMELVSAYAHLGNMDLVPQTHVRDLGTDRTGRLKLVGFGPSPRTPSAKEIPQCEADADEVENKDPDEFYQSAMQRAHQRLACCLHYILSGVDPDQEARALLRSPNGTSFREKVRRGAYPIAPAAYVLQDVLHEAWMLKAAEKPFSHIADKVRVAFEGLEVEQEDDLPARLPEDHYQSLEERCREWMKVQEQDPQWMELEEYKAACEQAGY